MLAGLLLCVWWWGVNTFHFLRFFEKFILKARRLHLLISLLSTFFPKDWKFVKITNTKFGKVSLFYHPVFRLEKIWNDIIEALYPAGNYMFKVNNRNTRTRCEVCSKLTIKTLERRQALLLTLNTLHILFLCFCCSLWTCNYWLGRFILLKLSRVVPESLAEDVKYAHAYLFLLNYFIYGKWDSPILGDWIYYFEQILLKRFLNKSKHRDNSHRGNLQFPVFNEQKYQKLHSYHFLQTAPLHFPNLAVMPSYCPQAKLTFGNTLSDSFFVHSFVCLFVCLSVFLSVRLSVSVYKCFPKADFFSDFLMAIMIRKKWKQQVSTNSCFPSTEGKGPKWPRKSFLMFFKSYHCILLWNQPK